jgi:CcmD family protein
MTVYSSPMQITPLPAQDTLSATRPGATPYDTTWSADIPTAAPDAFERVMLAEDKLFVVLAVVLVIWVGIVLFLFRTDRRLRDLERTLEAGIPEDDLRTTP